MTLSQPANYPSQHAFAGPVLQDRIGRRIGWAILASLVGNLLLWRGVAAMARLPIHFDPRPVEITRVIIQPNGRRIPKVIHKEEVKKRVVQARKKIEKPKPVPVVPRERPHVVEPPRERPQVVRHNTPAPVKPIKVASLPPPPTAHNRILTAPETKTAPSPDEHVVLPGGNAEVGKPMNQQGTGYAKTNPDVIVKKDVPKQPDPPKQPDTPKVAPAVQPTQPPVVVKKDVPAPDPPKQPDPPKLPDPPKKRGPTREAEPTDQTKPDIPDDLKHGDFKSFVRVAVDVEEDGSFAVTLRTSSGNPEIDNRVLEALKKWKWKPALKNGEPIKSIQRFKFEFLVE